jgi:signal transduction histidine kinase
LSDESGDFAYQEEGASRVASFASLATPPWTIVSSASVAEFAPPFSRTRTINLMLVLTAAAVISGAFLIVTRRLTRSLGVLTSAADRVAQGDFAPQLPATGSDEVGRLSSAFGLMVQQVRDMLRRIQESRHMAVIGQFASQLSHEIRNPLTSIKLNLQGLDRGVQSGSIPKEHERSIGICLREVKRLDGVAAGVLSMARTRSVLREPCSVHSAIDDSLEALRSQFEQHGIEIRRELKASNDTVRGDAEQLKGVFLNLFLNGADVMLDGGSLRVASENIESEAQERHRISIRVADSGPGIPAEDREKIFEPFFSTKEEGTGFGLALAQQTVEEHDGSLTLEESDGSTCGAVFAVELPVVPSEQRE